MIISGGYNVYPNEIEQVIMSRPDIVDCAVICVPHGVWGEQVTTILTLAPDAAGRDHRVVQAGSGQRLCSEAGREACDPRWVPGRPSQGSMRMIRADGW